jgi:hypothetical protein
MCYILTEEQKDLLQGKFFNNETFFNCIQDNSDNWVLVLSEQDKENLNDFNWVLELPEIDYLPKEIQTDLTTEI